MMMAWKLCFVGVLLFIFGESVKGLTTNVTLEEIYQASKNALESGDTEKNTKVIEKYYFTQDKENSVWYIAQMAALEMFNIPLGLEDMKFAERLIATVAKHYEECQKMPRGQLKAQCFNHLSTPIIDLERGTRFVTISDISHESRAKYGTIYNSATLLIAHIALIAKDNFQELEDPYLRRDKLHAYAKTIETSLRMLEDFDVDVVNTRKNAISAPVICEINERFWKQFEGICEVRWYTEGEIGEKKVANPRTVIEEIAGGDDEPKVVDADDQLNSREEHIILDRTDNIGTTCGKHCLKFRVQVVDAVKNKVLHEDFKTTNFASRGEAMTTLAREAMRVREKNVKEAEVVAEEFAKNTFSLNYQLLQKASAMLLPQ